MLRPSIMVMALAAAASAAEGGGEALAHLEKAITYHSEGDWAAAAREIEASLALEKDPRILFDLGESYRLLGEARLALKAYSQYLGELPSAKNAKEVKQLIVELTPYTFEGAPPPKVDKLAPRIRHEARADWPGGEVVKVEVTIEDPSGVFQPMLYYRLATSGPYVPAGLLPAGKDKYAVPVGPMQAGTLQYYLEAFDAQGNGPARNGTPSLPHQVHVGGGAPAAAAAASEAAPAAAVEVSAGVEEAPGRLWTWVAAGAAGVALAGGSWLGARSESTARDLQSKVSQHPDAQVEQVQSDALAANVLFGASALLGAGAVALFVLEF